MENRQENRLSVVNPHFPDGPPIYNVFPKSKGKYNLHQVIYIALNPLTQKDLLAYLKPQQNCPILS
jgi:hypothetical protein